MDPLSMRLSPHMNDLLGTVRTASPRPPSEPPKLWRETTPAGRRAIAEAAFDGIDALGLDLVIHPSAEAEHFGWSEAFGSEPLVYSISRYGRGERI